MEHTFVGIEATEMLLVGAMAGTNGDLEELGPKKFRILLEIAVLGSKYHLAAHQTISTAPARGRTGPFGRQSTRDELSECDTNRELKALS